MNQHVHMHTTTSISTHADFLVRLKKNFLKELLRVFHAVSFLIKILLLIIIGVILFVKEFSFARIVVAVSMPPLFIYIVGNHLTLLPVYLVTIMALVSIVSLASSKEGSNLMEWFTEIIDTIFQVSIESSPSTISQKLIGFVALSAIVSFFIVFFV